MLNIDKLPILLTTKEAAHLLRVSPLTIRRWDNNPKFPKCIRLGKDKLQRRRYSSAEVLEFIENENNTWQQGRK